MSKILSAEEILEKYDNGGVLPLTGRVYYLETEVLAAMHEYHNQLIEPGTSALSSPVASHSCTDGGSIEQDWLLWIKKCLTWSILFTKQHIEKLKSRERRMYYEIRLETFEEMMDAVLEEEKKLLNNQQEAQK